eukprot:g12909.t1
MSGSHGGASADSKPWVASNTAFEVGGVTNTKLKNTGPQEYVNLKSTGRMPAGHILKAHQKRMGVSDSLKTNEMWQKIGFDPYANPDFDASGKPSVTGVKPKGAADVRGKGAGGGKMMPGLGGQISGSSSGRVAASEDSGSSTMAAVAKLAGLSSTRTPGACSICGTVGHLSYQCRNTVQILGTTGAGSSAARGVGVLGLEEDSESDDASEVERGGAAGGKIVLKSSSVVQQPAEPRSRTEQDRMKTKKRSRSRKRKDHKKEVKKKKKKKRKKEKREKR